MLKSMLQAVLLSVLSIGLCAPVLAAPEPDAASSGARDVILLLDNSGSMKKNDPNFLARAAVRRFIEGLSGNVRLGIIIFDQNVEMAVQLTALSEQRTDSFMQGLAALDYTGLLTDSPRAVERAIYELKHNGRPGAGKSIVLMTDGIVDTGDRTRDRDRTQWLQDNLASDAASSGIRIFGIAFTENADFRLFQSLAQSTHAEYFRAYAVDELAVVFDQLSELLDAPVRKPVAALPAPTLFTTPSPVLAPVLAPVLTPVDVTAPPASNSAVPSAAQPGVVPERIIVQAAPVRAEDHPVTMWMKILIAVLVVLGGLALFIAFRSGRDGGVGADGGNATFQSMEGPIPQAFLVDLARVTDQDRLQLENRVTMVGRVAGQYGPNVNYIVIKRPTIGRQHAVIEYRKFAFWISDQDSTNGTFVNGKRITHEQRLHHGDRIRFHNVEFMFSMPDMSESESTQLAPEELLEKTALADRGVPARPLPVDPVSPAAARGTAGKSVRESVADVTGTKAEKDAHTTMPFIVDPATMDNASVVGVDDPFDIELDLNLNDTSKET